MSLPPAIVQGFARLIVASRKLRTLTAAQKRQALLSLADQITKASDPILAANSKDLAELSTDTTSAFRDRLLLNPKRLVGMVESLRQVANLPDPVGEVVEERHLPNGLHIRRVRAPLGVILMIFESRPNVILEAFSLAFKSGNAIALRGGSDSKWTAEVLYEIIGKTLRAEGLDEQSFLGISDYDRAIVADLLTRREWIDVVVPRGGDQLIAYVQSHSQMPIIKNDRGLCHAFIDTGADLDMAAAIVTNAKIQRPGVCNSLETVLVHRDMAQSFLPKLDRSTKSVGLKWLCDKESLAILEARPGVALASEKDWDVEHLDLIINCKVVAGLEEALKHIARHGSKHSETIITANEKHARVFQAEVDAAAVYWNASTRFTDGFEFGLGGELGISTQKLHVRGPVGLRELTTPRWIIDGTGQIRN